MSIWSDQPTRWYLPERWGRGKDDVWPRTSVRHCLEGYVSEPRVIIDVSPMKRLYQRVFMKQYKIIVEKCPDSYMAYPLRIKGVVVRQGDSYEEALSDVKSAIRFFIETTGEDDFYIEPSILKAFVAETGV